MELSVTLPWTPKELLPNRAHRWGKAARFGYAEKARKLRALAWGEAVRALGGIPQAVEYGKSLPAKIPVRIVLTPPAGKGRGRDEDAMLSSLKPAFDGLADAIRRDDKAFSFSPVEWRDKEGAGGVQITIAMED